MSNSPVKRGRDDSPSLIDLTADDDRQTAPKVSPSPAKSPKPRNTTGKAVAAAFFEATGVSPGKTGGASKDDTLEAYFRDFPTLKVEEDDLVNGAPPPVGHPGAYYLSIQKVKGERKVYCVTCNNSAMTATRGVIKSHMGSDAHKGAVLALIDAAKGTQAKITDSYEKVSETKNMVVAGGMKAVIANAVSLGVPASVIPQLYTPDIIACFSPEGAEMVSETTVSEAYLPDALEAVEAAIRYKLHDPQILEKVNILRSVNGKLPCLPGIIISDGATTHELCPNSSIYSLVWSSAYLEYDILLDVYIEKKSCKAERIRDMVLETLARYEIPHEVLIGIGGDNAAVNSRAADLLGVDLFKCVAHTGNLIVGRIMNAVGPIQPLLSSIRHFFNVGGSNNRKSKLEEFGLSISGLHYIDTRWGSAYEVVKYILQNWDDLKDFFRRITATEVSPGEDNQHLQYIREWLANPSNKLLLALFVELASTVVDLIEDSKGCDTSVGPVTLALVGRLDSLFAAYCDGQPNVPVTAPRDARRRLYNTIVKGAKMEQHIAEVNAERMHDGKKVPADPDRSFRKFESLILKAAEAARTKTHHLTTAERFLKYRRMYDMRVDPRTIDLEGQDITTALGMDARYADLNAIAVGLVQADYTKYVTAWPTFTDVDKGKSYRDFWLAKSTAYPYLFQVAMRWISVPTSSVAAERTFAQFRALEDFLRNRMKPESVRTALLFKFNRKIVQEYVAAKATRVKQIVSGTKAALKKVAEAKTAAAAAANSE